MTFDAFFLIVLMLVLGKLCAKARLFPDNAAEVLNQFAMYVCLPAAVLRYGSKLEIGPEILSIAAVPWGLGAIAVALVLALRRSLGWSREVCAVLLLCVPLGNTSYLGYPLVQAMRGEEALPYAVIYDAGMISIVPMANGNASDSGNWRTLDATQPGQDGERTRIIGDFGMEVRQSKTHMARLRNIG